MPRPSESSATPPATRAVVDGRNRFQNSKSDKRRSMEITKADLAEIISAAVKAAKAPNVIEQATLDTQMAARQAAQESRKALSQSVQEDKANKRLMQRLCSHEHRTGDTHCVFIQEKSPSPGYLLCQKN